MAFLNKKTVVGVFDSHAKAQQAVAELRHAGFRDDQIGVIARNVAAARDTDDDDLEDNFAGEGAATGIAAGAGLGALWGMGILAGVLPVLGPAIAGGALAAILTSAAAGAAAAGLAGALVGMGISKEEAEYYQREFHAGRVLVTVTANERAVDAENILRQSGGHDITNRRDAEEPVMSPDLTGQHSSHPSIGRTPDMGQHTAAGGSAMTPGGVGLDTHPEHRTLDVPVHREAVVREPVSGGDAFDPEIGEGRELQVPVRDEQVHAEEQAIVSDDAAGKRKRKS